MCAVEEGDYVLHPSGRLGADTSVSVHGVGHVGTYPTEEKAIREVRARMKKEGFFPNVWRVSDHGNPFLLNVERP